MAGKITQIIETKVTGLDDVKQAEKLVDKIDGTKAKATVVVDAKGAQKSVDEIVDDLRKLDGDNFTIALGLLDDQLQKQLGDILVDIAKLDGQDITIDAKMDQADQIAADIEKIETEIKRVNDTPIDIDTSHAKQGLDEVGKSADSSKSVLANMVGNATQDLGALGGVAGSAGVAIGQMGEYMADARASGEGFGSIAKSFGTMAVPIAAIGVATQIVSSHLADVAATKAFNRERVDSFVDAMKDGVTTAGELQKILSGGGTRNQLLVRVDDETRNAEQSVAKLFGTFTNFADAVKGGLPAYDAWADKQMEIAKASGVSNDRLKFLRKLLDDARDGTINGAMASGAYATALTTQMEAALAFGDAIAKGGTATEDAAFDAQFYGDVIGDAADAQVDLADESKFAARALAAQRKELGLSADAVNAYDTTLKSTDWGHAAVAAGVTAMESYSAQLNSLKDIAADAEEAQDNFTESVKQNGFTFDVATEKGRANQKALEDLGQAIDVKLGAAYARAGGNQDEFIASATKLGEDTLQKLAKQMGLSTKQTDELRKSLGLTATDYEARFKLAGDAEARAKLQLLQSSIDALPKDVQAQITQQIVTGDYQGAVATVQSYFNNHPPGMPTLVENPTTGEMQSAVTGANSYFAQHPARLPVNIVGRERLAEGGVAGPDGAVAGEVGAEIVTSPHGQRSIVSGATNVPPGTVVTSTSETARLLASLGIGQTSPTTITNNTVNVYVPQGYRERDAVEAAYRSTIRSGRLYANL